jgi:hypothetical protein
MTGKLIVIMKFIIKLAADPRTIDGTCASNCGVSASV